jgi:hypothetical protein
MFGTQKNISIMPDELERAFKWFSTCKY